MIKTVENGLDIVNVDPYFDDLVTSGIMFIAVLVDGVRNGVMERFKKPRIRMEE